MSAFTKLTSTIVVDGVPYDGIVDNRNAGETDSQFLSRHLKHVAAFCDRVAFNDLDSISTVKS